MIIIIIVVVVGIARARPRDAVPASGLPLAPAADRPINKSIVLRPS